MADSAAFDGAIPSAVSWAAEAGSSCQSSFETKTAPLPLCSNELKSRLGEKDARTVEARKRLAKLYDAWGKPDQALLFR